MLASVMVYLAVFVVVDYTSVLLLPLVLLFVQGHFIEYMTCLNDIELVKSQMLLGRRLAYRTFLTWPVPPVLMFLSDK